VARFAGVSFGCHGGVSGFFLALSRHGSSIAAILANSLGACNWAIRPEGRRLFSALEQLIHCLDRLDDLLTTNHNRFYSFIHKFLFMEHPASFL